jgi:hypothetical protein
MHAKPTRRKRRLKEGQSRYSHRWRTATRPEIGSIHPSRFRWQRLWGVWRRL